jgi:hypothetical protein
VRPTIHEPTGEHLSDDRLFALAVPPAGAPEPLPAHLLECDSCSRALAEWKNALREIGASDENVLAQRTPEEWIAEEKKTLAAIRRAGPAGSGSSRHLTWTLATAASLILFAFLVGGRQPVAPVPFDDSSGLSAEDRADDALLRDVDRLASGEEAGPGWSSLVPDPADGTADRTAPAEEQS